MIKTCLICGEDSNDIGICYSCSDENGINKNVLVKGQKNENPPDGTGDKRNLKEVG